MLSRAGLRSIRTLPRAAAPLAPRALPSQAVARRSVGGVSEREPVKRIPKDVMPLLTAVGFAVICGLSFLVRHLRKDPDLRTHRENAVDREPTDPPPPPPTLKGQPQPSPSPSK